MAFVALPGRQLWCFALVPRIWRGRRGAWAALRVISRRVGREFSRPPLNWLLLVGTVAIIPVWVIGDPCWAGLLTALVGLVGSGGIVVRLIVLPAAKRWAS
jgi:hypothetical protein